MKKLYVLFFSVAALMLYISCNKNNDLQNPDPDTIDSVNIMGFKDSTLLIKSLHRVDTTEMEHLGIHQPPTSAMIL